MKSLLRKLFSPILNPLEAGDAPYGYKRSHRTILVALSLMLSGLATLVFFLSQGKDLAYLFPVVVFGLISFIGLVVAFLGSDRAVAKIWGSR